MWHNAIQSSTQFSNGIEFSLDRKQLFPSNISVIVKPYIQFSQDYCSFKINKSYKLENRRTNLSLSATYSDRKDYYLLRSLVAKLGLSVEKEKCRLGV